jgi:hypothetical protein
MVYARAHPPEVESDAKIEERDTYVAELSTALSRHGHSVTVYTTTTGAVRPLDNLTVGCGGAGPNWQRV